MGLKQLIIKLVNKLAKAGWYEWRIKTLHKEIDQNIHCYTAEIKSMNKRLESTITEDIDSFISKKKKHGNINHSV